MADIAEIGFKADTSQLADAKTKLEAIGPAAAKAEQANDKLAKIMAELNGSVNKLTAAISGQISASDKAAKATEGVSKAADDAAKGMKREADAAAEAAAALKRKADAAAQAAKASNDAAKAAPRDLKAEAAAFRTSQGAYDAGLKAQNPGDRKLFGGVVPDFEGAKKHHEDLAKKAAEAEAASAKLNDKMKDTGDIADKSGSRMGGFAEGITRFAVSALAAVFAVDKLVSFVGNSIKEIAGLGETSKRTGIELERLQAIQTAGVAQGLTRSQVGEGLEGLAEKLNDAKNKETELGKLFDDNNLKLKTRTGEAISTNEALLQASGLVRNAATEFDKIKIAEALGLTKEWVPFLEQGREEIEKQVGAAEAAGGAFDKEMVKRADDFQKEWAVAIDKWRNFFMQAAIVITNAIQGMIDLAGRLWGVIGNVANYIQGARARQVIESNGVAGADSESIRVLRDRMQASGEKPNAELQSRFDSLDVEELYSVPFEIAKQNKALEVTVNGGGKGKKTDVSSLFPEKGGAGGNGKTDAEKFEDIVTRADARIAKLQAERDALTLTAEAAARLKYETDLLNQAKRADIELTPQQTEKLKELAGEMAKTEVSTKNLKSALDFGKDLTKGFLSDFLDGIKRGESVFESFGKAALNVLNKVADKLISMAVDGLFSSGGSSGGFWGSIAKFAGSLFTGGTGGLYTGASAAAVKFAKGGAFTNGIYNKPTLFQFANGAGFGEMGEAGAEAVMPLVRGPDGSLGVEMYGNAPTAANVDQSMTVENHFTLQGVVDKEMIVARIEQGVTRAVDTARRQMPNWVRTYNDDGAIV